MWEKWIYFYYKWGNCVMVAQDIQRWNIICKNKFNVNSAPACHYSLGLQIDKGIKNHTNRKAKIEIEGMIWIRLTSLTLLFQSIGYAVSPSMRGAFSAQEEKLTSRKPLTCEEHEMNMKITIDFTGDFYMKQIEN